MKHRKLQIIRFRLGGQDYGAVITQISEITRIVALNPFPNAPGFVEGVFNLRGEIVFAVDLRKRLGQPAELLTADSRILIVPLNGSRVGFMVDEVKGFEEITLDDMLPREHVPRELKNDLVFGVLKDSCGLLTLVNFAGVFRRQEKEMLRRLGTPEAEIIF